MAARNRSPYTDPVGQRRGESSGRRRTGARRLARSSASERWLLLLGVVAAIVIVIGMMGPWPLAPSGPRIARLLTMAQARASNAAVPIVIRRRVAASPYRFHGGPASRTQASECLATVALYEAGNGKRDQKAVIHVVLNRLRAPGFPKTVCGVVYQGFARAGCQFSFTCDGSFERRPVHLGWAQARGAARRALAGYVFVDVGGATHYHADWMVPYWRDSLVKVAQVGTHLFYVRR